MFIQYAVSRYPATAVDEIKHNTLEEAQEELVQLKEGNCTGYKIFKLTVEEI